MFDFGWSEVLLIAVVALIVVGPKELPILLRTVGRYVGVIRAQALAFREQVDDVIKSTELETLRDEMTELRDEVAGTVRETKQTLERDLEDTKKAMKIDGGDNSAFDEPIATADKPDQSRAGGSDVGGGEKPGKVRVDAGVKPSLAVGDEGEV